MSSSATFDLEPFDITNVQKQVHVGDDNEKIKIPPLTISAITQEQSDISNRQPQVAGFENFPYSFSECHLRPRLSQSFQDFLIENRYLHNREQIQGQTTTRTSNSDFSQTLDISSPRSVVSTKEPGSDGFGADSSQRSLLPSHSSRSLYMSLSVL